MSDQETITKSITVTPIAGALGAEIGGVDLSRLSAGESVDALCQVAGERDSPFTDASKDTQLLWREVLVLVYDDCAEVVPVKVCNCVVSENEFGVAKQIVVGRTILRDALPL